ncbi:MAG TPA: class I SAM-dependent methyltransferase [Desulfotomaculum sp.]|nr:class I SAM-dependent methyltransferase [Desulfotomaculum sp.]
MVKKVCWLCDSAGETIDGVDSPKYYHCRNCDLIFIDEAYILDHEQEKRRYSLHNNFHENDGYVKMFERFIDEAVRPFKSGLKRGLDFGCGSAPVLSELISAMGIQMDIYDPYFYDDLNLLEKRYDIITSTEVFEHLREPVSVLGFLKGLLNEGGFLSIMTLFHGDCPFKTWWYRQDSTHICFYSPRTCHWIARRFSMKIAYINNKNICVWQND